MDARFDEVLLANLARLRRGGVRLHLATVQEHERARHLWETLRLCNRFDAMHYAAAIGWRKSDPQFYAAVEARTGLPPDELLLIDDTPANVEIARSCGWRARHWTGQARLEEVLLT
jgi:putative hydrolase of the HAD superfamily